MEVSTPLYWRFAFPSLCTFGDLVQFTVLDVELLGPTRGKYKLADIQVARESDFGRNDTTFYVRSHLGGILDVGDTVMGFVTAGWLAGWRGHGHGPVPGLHTHTHARTAAHDHGVLGHRAPPPRAPR